MTKEIRFGAFLREVRAHQNHITFEKMYLAGEMDTPGMGVIYITSLDKIATFVPDEILDKLSK